jgi:transposase
LHVLDRCGGDLETVTIKGGWQKVVTWLRQRRRVFSICYEASVGYGPLHDALAKIARRVVVAHPGHLRLIFRSKQKNDRVDAKKLAKLLYLDEVPQVHVPDVDIRSWRELIEFRRKEVSKRTRVKNGIRGLLRVQGVMVPTPVRDLWTQKGRRWLHGFGFDNAHAQFQLQILLTQLEQTDRVVAVVTERLDALARSHPGIALLTTIPGVGARIAEAVLAYIDDPKRFARMNRIGAYFGLVPSQDSSASVNRLGHITRQGPSIVRTFLVEAAWQAIRACPQMREYFDRVVNGQPERKKIAIVATAHKLLRCMLAMLRSGETWRWAT